MLKSKERLEKMKSLNKKLGEEREYMEKVVFEKFDYWKKHTSNAKNINIELHSFYIRLQDMNIYTPKNYIYTKNNTILELNELEGSISLIEDIYNKIDYIEKEINKELEKQINGFYI